MASVPTIDLLAEERQETFQLRKKVTCFNAYLRRFKKRDKEMCCYCDFPVDTAEHALFFCA